MIFWIIIFYIWRYFDHIVNYFVHQRIQKTNYLNIFFNCLLQNIKFWLVYLMRFSLSFNEIWTKRK